MALTRMVTWNFVNFYVLAYLTHLVYMCHMVFRLAVCGFQEVTLSYISSSSTVSATMITIQGIGQTASGAAYDAQQLGQQSLHVNSHAWKRMTEKFLKGEPKILGVCDFEGTAVL